MTRATQQTLDAADGKARGLESDGEKELVPLRKGRTG